MLNHMALGLLLGCMLFSLQMKPMVPPRDAGCTQVEPGRGMQAAGYVAKGD